MRPRHITLALLTIVIWGLNFIAIHVALRTVPPLFLCVLRFVFVAFPAVFFVPRPRIAFSRLALYGLATFVVQFSLLFSGMKAGLSPGLASLVLQVQVFFTIALAMRIFGDRPPLSSWIGALVAFAGIVLIALHSRGEVSALGLFLLLAAALGWAVGNVAARGANGTNPFGLVIWSGALAVPPLLVLSLALEGPAAIAAALAHPSLEVVGSLAYIVYGSTLLGYSIWADLLRRYPSPIIAPFTLLVPVVGFLGSAALIGEPLPPWKLGAAALVLVGLALNLFGHRVVGAVIRLALARQP